MKNGKIKSFSRVILLGLLMLMVITGLYSLLTESAKPKETISLSQLVSDINSGKISQIAVKGDDLAISYKDNGQKAAKKESETALSQTLANYGVSKESLDGVAIDIQDPSSLFFWVGNILPFLIPLLIIVVFFWLAGRQVKSANLQAFSFGQSRARVVSPDDQKERITFKDVAGVKEAKEELQEIVEFLKNPKKFLDIGARIPKGVLLMGAPGTGKTLLARAVAGEAGVPFFHISGSEFVELFVGVGASRVRSLFKEAKKAAPSIMFIDEIDAVGRHRGAGLGGGHDEREQTLNQILVEMDGFEPHEKVIVMAASNRPDVLDPALLRPGRFDRRVILDLPDIGDREQILKIHAREKPLESNVNLRNLAERTPGFSGADLQNLMNEAAILTARQGRKKISQNDLINSIEKVLLGPERKSHILSPEEKKIASYHEAGHALAAAALPHADPVHKVSIVSRGRVAGYTLKLPIQERHLYSKSHFLDELVVSLGGYAAEKIVFKDLTTGAADDLRKATDIARALITKYGMSEKVGPITLAEEEELVFLGKELGMTGKHYSEKTAKLVDDELSRIMKESFKRAKIILEKNRSALNALAKKLIEKESIEKQEFEEIMKSFGLNPKTAAEKHS